MATGAQKECRDHLAVTVHPDCQIQDGAESQVTGGRLDAFSTFPAPSGAAEDSHTGLRPAGGEGQGLPPTPTRHTRAHAHLVPAEPWLCRSRPHFLQAGCRTPCVSAQGGSGLLQACGPRGPCHSPRSPCTLLRPPPTALVPRPTRTGRPSESPTGLRVASTPSPFSRGPSPTAWAHRRPCPHHAALPQPPGFVRLLQRGRGALAWPTLVREQGVLLAPLQSCLAAS